MRRLPIPINICFLVNYLGFGGAERQLVELAQGLDKDQFRAFVVTLRPGGDLEAELEGQHGITIHTLNRRNKIDMSPIITLARFLRRNRIHIMQPYLSPATLFGLTASFLTRTPIRIVTERCGLRKDRGLGNKIYRYLEDRLTRFADLAVANSEAGRQYLHARGISPDTTRVIYNGINPQRLQPNPEVVKQTKMCLKVPSDGLVIGNVASLTRPKDQATILRAAAALIPEFPGLRLALVGDGPLRIELEGLARKLGLDSHVVFFGNQYQVANHIAAFDLAVLSSVDNEGCSNFLLEAMGLGKPVIATDVGGNCELVRPGENGWLIPPGDSQALVVALRAALNNDAGTRDSMGAMGQKMVATRFSLPRMVEAHQELYRDLAQRKMGISFSADRMAA